ncbi:unnamed protein product [Victoria cruziana]
MQRSFLQLLPPIAYPDNPATSFATKFVHASTNKNRCSINRVLWTPTGRRLITGSQSGEFTLWNGQSFNFEMILQAHDQAIRSMVWSHNENWMVTGDDGGSIKYWQTNMNNVKANKSAHRESVRDLSFSRTDLKFCSCSDDTTVKVWDFARCQEERSLAGHGWDVKSVDWHPTKSLLVSGGKDNLVKLWDAKTGKELCSFHGHKNTVLCVKWNQNGNWVLTAGKDQIIKLYDIRAMKELESFRGHRKDVTALAWHPFHEEYFVSGSFDGSIFHWLVGHETPQVELHNAHENSVWDLAWHPVGYLLCSGSNDHTTKFWCRNRPGDPSRDKHNIGSGDLGATAPGRFAGNFPAPDAPPTPGPFAAGLARSDGTIPGVGAAMPFSMLPLDGSDHGEQRLPIAASNPIAPHPPSVPHPSLLQPNQQAYQQVPQHVPGQLQHKPLQPPMMPLPPTSLPQLQPPSQLPLLAHPSHLPRPPPIQFPSLSIPASGSASNALSMPIQSMSVSLPLPMPGSASDSLLPRPTSLQSSNYQPVLAMPGQGLQGSATQIPQLSQPPLGMNPMIAGPMAGSSVPPALNNFSNGMTSAHVPSSTAAGQGFVVSGVFGRPQSGQLAPVPGINAYQAGVPSMMEMRPGSLALPPNINLPPGPPPHSRGSTS